MPSVFLRYSSNDKLFARKLATDLKNQGIKVLIDESGIKVGISVVDKMREAIDSSDYLAVILSPQSVRSKWLKKEAERAMERETKGKRTKILTLIAADCDIPLFLRDRVLLDFRDQKYDTGLKSLLELLGVSTEPKDKSIENYEEE